MLRSGEISKRMPNTHSATPTERERPSGGKGGKVNSPNSGKAAPLTNHRTHNVSHITRHVMSLLCPILRQLSKSKPSLPKPPFHRERRACNAHVLIADGRGYNCIMSRFQVTGAVLNWPLKLVRGVLGTHMLLPTSPLLIPQIIARSTPLRGCSGRFDTTRGYYTGGFTSGARPRHWIRHRLWSPYGLFICGAPGVLWRIYFRLYAFAWTGVFCCERCQNERGGRKSIGRRVSQRPSCIQLGRRGESDGRDTRMRGYSAARLHDPRRS